MLRSANRASARSTSGSWLASQAMPPEREPQVHHVVGAQAILVRCETISSFDLDQAANV